MAHTPDAPASRCYAPGSRAYAVPLSSSGLAGCGFVVGTIALADRAFTALAIFRMIHQPLPDLRRIGLHRFADGRCAGFL